MARKIQCRKSRWLAPAFYGLHTRLTIQTAVLIETLVDLGAEVLDLLRYFLDAGSCSAAIAAAGVRYLPGKVKPKGRILVVH